MSKSLKFKYSNNLKIQLKKSKNTKDKRIDIFNLIIIIYN